MLSSKHKCSDKICICFPFVGDSLGGSVISSAMVVGDLSQDPRFRIIVLLHERGTMAAWLEHEGIDVVFCEEIPHVQLQGNLLLMLIGIYRAQKSIKRFLAAHSVDIVHTNDGRMHLTWGIAAYRSQCRHIWHQRTRFAKSRLVSYLARFPDRIIAISEFVKKTIPKDSRARVLTVANPLRPRSQLPQKIQKKELIFNWSRVRAEETIVIGFVGTFNRQKRIEDFVAIAAHLKKAIPPIQKVFYTVVGKEGDYSCKELRTLFDRKELEGQYLVEDYRYNIVDWYEAIDILIAPAQNEGFGRNIMEAVERSTMVVASNSGGHAEVVGSLSTGMIVELGNIEQYVDAIVRFIQSRNANERELLLSRRTVIRRFNHKQISKLIASEYIDLVNDQ